MKVDAQPEMLTAEARSAGVNGPYARYVLIVLMFVYLFNFLDRQILNIVSEDVKHRLDIADSQLGFLYGTAFGMFYALFGYPLGRLVDRCPRIPVLVGGLVIWSAMTCLSGVARSFNDLALARVGVGIGEATAAPCAYSLLSDWFSKPKRGAVMGVYTSGIYIGSGLSLAIGGVLVVSWNRTFAHGGAPFGLEGWQAAFFGVGLPGLLIALWVSTLREPRRGQADGIVTQAQGGVVTALVRDLASVLPPLTLLAAMRGGWRGLASNLVAAAAFAAIGTGLVALTGDVLQWSALAIGAYAVFSTAQSLRLQDRATFALTWASPAFVYSVIGFSCVAMLNAVMSFWVTPLALRTFDMDKASVGLILGATWAVFGVLGVLLGGRMSDFLLRRSPIGRLGMGVFAVLSISPFVVLLCLTDNPLVFFLCNIPIVLFGISWVPSAAAVVQDLALPRMRGTAAATYFIWLTIISLGLGPYAVGKASVVLGNLHSAIPCALLIVPVSLFCFYMASKSYQEAEANKAQKAALWGEATDR